jgi:hypothetical protein
MPGACNQLLLFLRKIRPCACLLPKLGLSQLAISKLQDSRRYISFSNFLKIVQVLGLKLNLNSANFVDADER